MSSSLQQQPTKLTLPSFVCFVSTSQGTTNSDFNGETAEHMLCCVVIARGGWALGRPFRWIRGRMNGVLSSTTRMAELPMKADMRPGESGWPKTKRQLELCYYRVVEGMTVNQAALTAGYSDQTARKKAGSVLKGLRPYCSYLQRLKNQEMQGKFEITVDRIAEELACIAFANIDDYVTPVEIDGDWRFVGRPINELTDKQARAIASWSVDKIKSGEQVIYDYRYVLYDKKGALLDLGKHLGMFSERLLLEARVHQQAQVDLSGVPDEVLEKWMAELQTYQPGSTLEGEHA